MIPVPFFVPSTTAELPNPYLHNCWYRKSKQVNGFARQFTFARRFARLPKNQLINVSPIAALKVVNPSAEWRNLCPCKN
jgi:hypothetical protein